MIIPNIKINFSPQDKKIINKAHEDIKKFLHGDKNVENSTRDLCGLSFYDSLPQNLEPDCFIGCSYAFPHTDEMFSGEKFLILTVKTTATYMVGSSNFKSAVINEGQFFVVDPMAEHWVFPEFWSSDEFWVGVNWSIPKEGFDVAVKKIIKSATKAH